MIKSESLINLTKALIAVKKELEPVLRDNSNPFLTEKNNRDVKYADLAQVIDATDPQLFAHGLTITQFPISEGGHVGVFTLLLHESGEYLGEGFTLPLAKSDAQTGTAAVTYARRSGIKAVLGLKEVDDDGETASGRGRSEQDKPAPAKKPQQTKPAPAKTTAPKSQPVAASKPTAAAAVQTAAPAPTEDQGPDRAPTKEEGEEIRKKWDTLRDTLEKGGAEKPTSRYLLKYLLNFTGAPNADVLGIAGWNKFFTHVNAAIFKEGGVGRLVGEVNSAFGGENGK